MVGVNFVADDNLIGGEQPPGGAQNGWLDSLQPTDLAGMFPQTNWNNMGRFGSRITLEDHDGVSSGVGIAWTALGMWHCSGQTGFPPGPPFTNPNAKLMDGYLESTWGLYGLNGTIAPGTAVTNITDCAPVVYLSGLQQYALSQGSYYYSIVLYCNSANTNCSHSEYWIDAASESSYGITVGAPVTPPIFVTHCTRFNGTFTQVSPLATNDATASDGNCIIFSGLTNDEILIVSQNLTVGPSAAINGIQVITPGIVLPPPGLLIPWISPTNIISLGTTVTISAAAYDSYTPTYQWQTDGGGGGSLTNIPGASNSSLITTPTAAGIWNYDVVVTNNSGSATSFLATVTVLPASAPILTSDINIYSTNVYGFIGGSVNIYANFGLGTLPITNQWLVKLDSGGDYAPIGGGTSSAWTLANLQSSSAGNYRLAATNAIGSSNSSPAHLTPLADPPPPPSYGVTNLYANCVMTNHPWAYWRFEETNDTIHNSMQAYDYSGHNFDATYGNSDGTANSGCLDGGGSIAAGGAYGSQYGPNPAAGFSGFNANNGCATMSKGNNNGYLTVPPLNLNTNNNVTFTMWIYIDPTSLIITPGMGLFMNRNGSDAAGMGFGRLTEINAFGIDGSSVAELGYTWNTNNAVTYNWDSHLFPCPDTWNFVACTITPTNTTMYLYYLGMDQYFNPTTNMLKAVQSNVTNTPEAFSGGTIWLGGDNGDNTRTFDGSIDEVAVFTNALSEAQIQQLFLEALGLTNGIPPYFSINPTNTTVFTGQTLQLVSSASAYPAPWYQWQVYTGSDFPPPPQDSHWSSMAVVLGRTTTNSTLYWTNYTGPYTNFRCIATNIYGAATSSVAAVTLIPVANWNKGLRTVNFAITPNHGIPYYGHGVLGTNSYWNALSDKTFILSGITCAQFTNHPPSLLDDGATVCGINFGSYPVYMGASWSGGMNNVLLDNFCSYVAGTTFVFTSVPSGIYNLALYGIGGANAGNGNINGAIFTVNGVSQSVTNAQDLVFLPDNTVVYTNLVVTNGTLKVNMVPIPGQVCPAWGCSGPFNGAQLELIRWGPNVLSITNQGANMVLTYVGGQLLEATNLSGPWTTNLTATSPFTISPTGRMKFYRVYTNSLPH